MTRQTKRDIRRGDGFIQERTAKDETIRYQARWPELQLDGSTTFRSKTFGTEEEAEDHLRKVGRERRRGTYVRESDLTVRQMLEEHMERLSHRVTESTLWAYGVNTRLYILPYLGSEKVVALTPRRLQVWVDGLSARDLSASLVKNVRNQLSGALNDCVRLGIIPANPNLHTRAPRYEQGAIETWTNAECATVLESVAGDPKLFALYMVAISTGMRPGELCGLRWRDIDVETNTITCAITARRNKAGTWVLGNSTKTKRTRQLAVPAEVTDAIQRWRTVQLTRRLAHTAWHDLDLVFDRGDGAIWPNPSMRRRHLQICEKAGVTPIRLHGFRHTFGSLEFQAGTHPKIVQMRLGHKDVATTLNIYSHASPDMSRDAAEASMRRILSSHRRENSRENA